MANEEGRKDQTESTPDTQKENSIQTLMERARAEAVVNAVRNGYGEDVQGYLRDISAWH